MPVPTLITQLSTTAGDNSPVGSVDAPSSLDNYIRANASFIAILRDAVDDIEDGTTTVVNATNATNATDATNITGTTQSAAITWSGKQTHTNAVKLEDVIEKVTITDSAPTGTFDVTAQGIQFFGPTAATGNWTQNFSNVNTSLAIGESITATLLVTMGATGYLPTTIQVDGSTVTAKYLGGTTWTADASCVSVFTFTIIKTADAAFTVLASKSKYA